MTLEHRSSDTVITMRRRKTIGTARVPAVQWRRYADGKVHVLRHGRDHVQPVDRARRTLIQWCHRHGLRPRTRVHEDGTTWSVRITPRL